MSFSDYQTSVLLTYFSNGMVGTGSKFSSQINAAVAETGLRESQVKNWITKKLYRCKGNKTVTVSNIPRRQRSKSPWNAFQKEYASTEEGQEYLRTGLTTFNKFASEKFQSLDNEDKSRLSHIVENEIDIVLTESQIINKISDIFVQLCDRTCKTLESYRCHAVVVGFRNSKVYLAGNGNLVNKLDDHTIKMIHAALFSGSNSSKLVRRKEKEKELRQEVQALFNTKYEEGTGRNGPFPYKNAADFQVEGLPGVQFKKPSGYGVSQLHEILENRDHIKIKIKDVSPSTISNPITSAPTTPNPNTPGPIITVPVTPNLTLPTPIIIAPISPTTTAPIISAPNLNCLTPIITATTIHNSTTAAPIISAPNLSPLTPIITAPTFPKPTTTASFITAPITPYLTPPAPIITAPNLTAHPIITAPTTPNPTTTAAINPNLTHSALIITAPNTPNPTTVAPIITAPTIPKQTPTAHTITAPIASNPNPPAPIITAPTTSNPTTTAPIITAPTTSNPTSIAPIAPNLTPPALIIAALTTPHPTTIAPIISAPTSPNPSEDTQQSGSMLGEASRVKSIKPRFCRRHKRIIEVYPFWTDVFMKIKGGPIVGEGVIVPGFNCGDINVQGIYRKIYVTTVYDCNTDESIIKGEFVVRPLYLLVPTNPSYKQGIGGLVNTEISRNFRCLKANVMDEEVCEALSCQCPTSEEISWIQCSAPDCGKWFHLHCVGLLEEDEKPDQWLCQGGKHTDPRCFSKKEQYENLVQMLMVVPVVEDHLKLVITNSIASARNVIFVKHERKERENILGRLMCVCNSPFSDEVEEDFQDIIMGLFIHPDRKWDDNTTTNLRYVTDVLGPEAYVRFVMEVEHIPRHVAEVLLYNWTTNVPQMLVDYRSRNIEMNTSSSSSGSRKDGKRSKKR